MRQQLSFSSHPQENNSCQSQAQSHDSKKQRIDKKRAIRKNKMTSVKHSQQESSARTYQKSNLTKQQKALLQKSKNRQAAQKSRDLHKKYVQDLQNENKQLKQQLAKPRYCSKCYQLLHQYSNGSTGQSLNQEPSRYETYYKQQNSLEFNDYENQNNKNDEDFDMFEKDDRSLHNILNMRNDEDLMEFDNAPFERVRNNTGDIFSGSGNGDSFKMILFISMIVLGLMVMNGGSGDGTAINNGRGLMEIQIAQATEENSDSLNDKCKKIEQNQNIPQQNINIQRDSRAGPYKKSIQVPRNLKSFTKAYHQPALPSPKQLNSIKQFDMWNKIQNSFNMQQQSTQQYYEDDILSETIPFLPLSQSNCLKSLILKNYTITENFTSNGNEFTSIDNIKPNTGHQMSVFVPQTNTYTRRTIIDEEPSLVNQQPNVLFCSLPKLYRKEAPNSSHNLDDSGIFTKVIDIILSGSEMMEILGTDQSNFWMNKIINFNGLYKINAEIRGVSQLQDTNCIL